MIMLIQDVVFFSFLIYVTDYYTTGLFPLTRLELKIRNSAKTCQATQLNGMKCIFLVAMITTPGILKSVSAKLFFLIQRMLNVTRPFLCRIVESSSLNQPADLHLTCFMFHVSEMFHLG